MAALSRRKIQQVVSTLNYRVKFEIQSVGGSVAPLPYLFNVHDESRNKHKVLKVVDVLLMLCKLFHIVGLSSVRNMRLLQISKTAKQQQE